MRRARPREASRWQGSAGTARSEALEYFRTNLPKREPDESQRLANKRKYLADVNTAREMIPSLAAEAMRNAPTAIFAGTDPPAAVFKAQHDYSWRRAKEDDPRFARAVAASPGVAERMINADRAVRRSQQETKSKSQRSCPHPPFWSGRTIEFQPYQRS
jgi:hypothetical protein